MKNKEKKIYFVKAFLISFIANVLVTVIVGFFILKSDYSILILAMVFVVNLIITEVVFAIYIERKTPVQKMHATLLRKSEHHDGENMRYYAVFEYDEYDKDLSRKNQVIEVEVHGKKMHRALCIGEYGLLSYKAIPEGTIFESRNEFIRFERTK